MKQLVGAGVGNGDQPVEGTEGLGSRFSFVLISCVS